MGAGKFYAERPDRVSLPHAPSIRNPFHHNDGISFYVVNSVKCKFVVNYFVGNMTGAVFVWGQVGNIPALITYSVAVPEYRDYDAKGVFSHIPSGGYFPIPLD